MYKDFWASDYGLAAYLIVRGFEYIGFDANPNKKTVMVFPRTTEIAQAAEDYTEKRGTVEPLEYSQVLRKVVNLFRENRPQHAAHF